MNTRYYIDPETGLPHIYRHNVSENEVEDVLLKDQEGESNLQKSFKHLPAAADTRTLEVNTQRLRPL
jgi:hypothetical protein